MTTDDLTVVTGAGGFIGGHLVADLRRDGRAVRAVDMKPVDEWYQRFDDVENVVADLRQERACFEAAEGASSVYNLAADMGGMGFIENNRALCMLSVLINTHLLQAAVHHGVKRYFFSSSACVYAAEHQRSPEVVALSEGDAYPAQPEDGYGWEKLFSERMCRHFREDFGLETRVARYHNVYGPHGTWSGGREKAPAAICRKVIEAVMSGNLEIEIWGDGKQTRSFMYIDACVEGTRAIMNSDILEPINLGSAELVTIDELVDIVEDIAGVSLKRRYNLDAPQGVRGRNSDNTMILDRLGWQPDIGLREGLEQTYRWIHDEVRRAVPVPRPDPGAPLPRTEVLGVGISAVTMELAVAEIERRIREGDQGFVTLTGVHGVMEARRSLSVRQAHDQAAMVCPDGMPMVWSCRYAGFDWVERVYGPDLMLELCPRSLENGWRHFFYGGGPGVAPRLADQLRSRFPGLQVCGVHTPPFRPLDEAETAEVVDHIDSSGADVLWIGLSTPKQELWMAEMHPRLAVPVALGVGAAFDFHAGLVPQAPPWVQRSGLEWLYRLGREPRRLWRRYLTNNPAFVAAILRQPPHRVGSER